MARNVSGSGRLDAGLLTACIALAIFALVMPVALREQVAQTIRAGALAPLLVLEGRATAIRATIVSREDVLTARGDVAVETLSTRAINEENQALRKIMGLGSRLQSGFVAAELLPTRAMDEDFEVALNVGTAAGVEPFTPVVTADGLFGMIRTADRNTSFAITWAHPDFAVSAMSADEAAFGIVAPHLGTGIDRLMLEFRGVPFRTALDTGTVVVSSGLGSTYPRGIVIGTVISEIATAEKWARTYLLRPAALPSAGGPVLVLLPDRASRGVNDVWTSVASADSASRAIAAAGDSTARDAALAELAARRVALDSAAGTQPGSDTLARRPLSRTDSTRADSAKRSVRSDTTKPKPTGPPPVGPKPGPPPGPPPETHPVELLQHLPLDLR